MKLYELTEAFIRLNVLADKLEDSDAPQAVMDELRHNLDIAEGYASEKLENLAKWRKNLLAEAEIVKAEKDRLAKRQKSLENKAEMIRSQLIQPLLRSMRQDSVKTPLFTIFTRTTKSVNINDRDLIDQDYRVYKWEPDKTQIKSDLENGLPVPGAEIVENESVTIR